jgi:hypothetical protein
LLACFSLVASGFAAAQGVRFSELHYDNVGTDAAKPSRWRARGTRSHRLAVVLYNGSQRLVYNTQTLTARFPRPAAPAVSWSSITRPTGIQNGAPDGMAL